MKRAREATKELERKTEALASARGARRETLEETTREKREDQNKTRMKREGRLLFFGGRRREGERNVDFCDEKGKENEGVREREGERNEENERGRHEMVAVPSDDAEKAAAIGERERERYRG